MKKYQNFYRKTSSFLWVKFSIYLNRRVFVMQLNKGISKSDDPNISIMDFIKHYVSTLSCCKPL